MACAWLGFVGDDTFHAVFPVVVHRSVMLGIMAVMDQKNGIALFAGSGMYKAGIAGIFTPRDVSLPWLAGP